MLDFARSEIYAKLPSTIEFGLVYSQEILITNGSPCVGFTLKLGFLR
jgi:hypothetical protein